LRRYNLLDKKLANAASTITLIEMISKVNL
jgi:hypothetical protein